MKIISRNVLMSAFAFISLIALFTFYSCDQPYRKMNPPADADKPGGAGVDNSCYLATAANMLAGAGYGNGASLQARADDIYNDLTTQFGIANGGWTDVALNWWLGSANNTWTTNPYTMVTVYGNKSPKFPWANSNGTQFYANELRRCCFVGLSISWPAAGATVGSGGHAITAWGDSFGNEPLTINTVNVTVTDSDTDTGGNEQNYTYDTYISPNPGGANEGNGWYMNYSNNHPYVKHIITLCPTDDPTDHVQTQKVTGSYRLPQNSKESASDLHYSVSTDVEILSYKTWIDWETENNPVITESGSPRNRITVDWDLSDNAVPQGKEVTITTEFILPSWNAMSYSDVYWTYPDGGSGTKPGKKFTEIRWTVETPLMQERNRLPNNVTGGFLIGSFELISYDDNKDRIILPYRFVHEYNYNQRPDQHVLQIAGNPPALIRNLRIGNSWNYLESNELWKFNEWLTTYEKEDSLGREPLTIKVDWTGKVPYPEGENIYNAIPDINGKPRDPNKN